MVGSKRNEKRIPRRIKMALLGGLTFFLWTSSTLLLIWIIRLLPATHAPDPGAFATTIFGGSSIALILFSLLLGGGALLGYQSLREIIKKDVEADTRKSLENLEKEMRGRVYFAVGLMTGTLYSNPYVRKQSDRDKDYLSEAVWACREAYKILKGLEGSAKYTALNNLVYYSCLLYDGGVEDPSRDAHLLKQARVLRDIAQEKDFPEGLLTYCRAVLQYARDAEEVREAHAMAAALSAGGALNDRQKKEVTFYVTSLSVKINEMTGT